MRLIWRIAFAVLVASGYAIFYHLQHVQHGLTWDTVELTYNAQAHAGVLGVFAGFIAAVVVIFLTAKDEETKQGNADVSKFGAIGTFLCAFLIAILGSFQYASFTGFTEYWKTVAGESQPTHLVGFPSYLFNVLGVHYLLAVYLCFYGLVLTIQHFAKRSELTKLTYFMLITVYLLGSAWVFLDFGVTGVSTRRVPLGFSSVGALYISLVVTAGLMPNKWPPLSSESLLRLLFVTLALCLAFAVGLGGWYAMICFLKPAAVAPCLDKWMLNTIWTIAGIMGALFALLTFCLNRVIGEPEKS